MTGGGARPKPCRRTIHQRAITSPTTIFASWDFRGIVSDGALLHALGRDLANSAAWPNWSADSEFKAMRDRSAAERGAAARAPVDAPAMEPAGVERG